MLPLLVVAVRRGPPPLISAFPGGVFERPGESDGKLRRDFAEGGFQVEVEGAVGGDGQGEIAEIAVQFVFGVGVDCCRSSGCGRWNCSGRGWH